ncbi:DNA phosphorothioation-associated protein 4 [Actinomadura chibensis]|uniref:DNA phosphorothioation-associated protein 4 n=1 Tax=Actinomadura chibensis TaxID=392828 RepID=A0A5D0NYF9_9ACTN|nr:DNA phosphorothioation-associated protein 4 [Actinomadura chibensis]TYB49194.1 DNA phosphorothioation-associated protein 4 [Actinomadura chibensis]
MVLNADIRVRPPQEHHDLIERLLQKNDGLFPTRWQVLLFAAALGWSRQRRDPFEKQAEPIRYGLFNSSATVAAVIDSIGVLAHPNDATIMADDRLPERIRVFEEYANGGLSIIQGELNAPHSRPMDVILDLCRRGSTRAERRIQGLFGANMNSEFDPPEFD